MSFLARNVYPSVDGVTSLFSVSYDYLAESDVYVFIDKELYTDWTFQTASSVQLNTPAPTGSEVIVIRGTDIDVRLVDYENLARLTEADLDDDSLQAFYKLQELQDGLITGFIVEMGPNGPDLGGVGLNGDISVDSLTWNNNNVDGEPDLLTSIVPFLGQSVFYARPPQDDGKIIYSWRTNNNTLDNVVFHDDGRVSATGTPQNGDDLVTLSYLQNYSAGGNGGEYEGGNIFDTIFIRNPMLNGQDIKIETTNILDVPFITFENNDGGLMGMLLQTTGIIGKEAYVGFRPQGQVFGSDPVNGNDFVTLSYLEDQYDGAFGGSNGFRINHLADPANEGAVELSFQTYGSDEYLIVRRDNLVGAGDNLGLLFNVAYDDDNQVIGKTAGITPNGQGFFCCPTQPNHAVTREYMEDNLATDAPSNGAAYARKDGSWVQVADLPEDLEPGKKYGFSDTGWVQLTEGGGAGNGTYDEVIYTVDGQSDFIVKGFDNSGVPALYFKPVDADAPSRFVFEMLYGTAVSYVVFDEAGRISFNGTPTDSNHATTIGYCDANYMSKTPSNVGQYQVMKEGVWVDASATGYLSDVEIDTKIAEAINGGTLSYQWAQIALTGAQDIRINNGTFEGGQALFVYNQDAVGGDTSVVFQHKGDMAGFRKGRGFSELAPTSSDEYIRLGDGDARYTAKTNLPTPTAAGQATPKSYVDKKTPVAVAIFELADPGTALVLNARGIDDVQASGGVIAVDLEYEADLYINLMVIGNATDANTGAPLMLGYTVVDGETINVWATDHTGTAVTSGVYFHLSITDIFEP